MTTTLLAAVLAAGTTQIAATGCTGPDAAIVAVKKMPPATDASGVTRYPVSVTVQNVGSKGQAGNALDSVAMYVDGHKTDVKGLQPLAAGASQTVVFSVQRSADAGMGTTTLRFAMKFTSPAVPPDCNPGNDVSTTRL